MRLHTTESEFGSDVFIVDVEHPDLDVPKSGCIHPDLDVYGLKHPDAQKLTRI